MHTARRKWRAHVLRYKNRRQSKIDDSFFIIILVGALVNRNNSNHNARMPWTSIIITISRSIDAAIDGFMQIDFIESKERRQHKYDPSTISRHLKNGKRKKQQLNCSANRREVLANFFGKRKWKTTSAMVKFFVWVGVSSRNKWMFQLIWHNLFKKLSNFRCPIFRCCDEIIPFEKLNCGCTARNHIKYFVFSKFPTFLPQLIVAMCCMLPYKDQK